MVVKHCVYKDCKSDSRYWERDYMKGVCFIRFPSPTTHRQRCQIWVNACDREDLTIDLVNDKTYICSKHFVGGNGPTRTCSDPLPPSQLLEVNQIHVNSENPNNSFNNFCDKYRSVINQNNTKPQSNDYFNDKIQTKTVIIEDNNEYFSVNNELKYEPKHNNEDSFSCNKAFTDTLITDSQYNSSNIPNSMVNSSQIHLNELSNNEPYNTSNEVQTNSLPLIIFPSNNHTLIGSTFSGTVMPIVDENQWFDNFLTNDLYEKLEETELSIGRIGKRLVFSSISGCIVNKQLIIENSGNFDVKVWGQSLYSKNNFYKLIPILITNKSDLNLVINKFISWKVCVANEMSETVFEDKIIAIRAFVCVISDTIRSKNCELLIPENASIRCKSCKMLLNRIRRLKYSQNKDKSIEK